MTNEEENSEPSNEQLISVMVAYVASQLREGVSVDSIRSELIEKGVPDTVVDPLISAAHTAKEEQEKKGQSDLADAARCFAVSGRARTLKLLRDRGYSSEDAKQAVKMIQSAIKSARSESRRSLAGAIIECIATPVLMGLGLALLGLILSWGSEAIAGAAGGKRYIVFTGLIFGGLAYAVIGGVIAVVRVIAAFTK